MSPGACMEEVQVYVHLINPTPGVVIEACEFNRNNSYEGSEGLILGGSHIPNCKIEHNESSDGAAIALAFSHMENCIITDNTRLQFGGGVELIASSMADCMVARNSAVRGGGI